ncbi:hypothetical protein GUJ93_ZPchr0009g1428 [Zizania palustris]|uniref:LOB domain-containing protein n=1 Tax=Zizania palustris TaxID=103762 RepID=A0A8J5RBM9_ZIZPA|nr:hypothetical protein GUJ93_ZPchr0009g1428 [Zizania palustris]
MAGSGTPCASCKLLRRRCTPECVFAPYFPAEDARRFATVHRVFGASNVSRMLQEVAPAHRADAVSSLVYEASARVRDPVYGCVAAISSLQQQVSQLQMQLALAHAEILICVQQPQQHGHPPAAAALQEQQQQHVLQNAHHLQDSMWT